MSRLSLSLLGAFQASLDGEPITGFESAMVRALLAYLAVESDRPHRRETLAALLWPEQPEGVARNRLRHALSNLRKTVGDRDAVPPFLLVTRETVQFNCASDCWLDVHAFRAVQELAEVVLGFWTEHGMEMAEACGMLHRAWVSSEQGQHEEGSAQFDRGLAAWQATGMAMHLPEFLAVRAEMHGRAGDPEKGLSTVEEALALAHNSGERYYEAELYRLRGQLLLMPDVGDEHGAEASFYQAIEVARRRNAKMCELRATASLCHLWLTQEREDKYTEAHEMLAGVYDWFTEGFDTRDLQEAKAVLDALGAGQRQQQ